MSDLFFHFNMLIHNKKEPLATLIHLGGLFFARLPCRYARKFELRNFNQEVLLCLRMVLRQKERGITPSDQS